MNIFFSFLLITSIVMLIIISPSVALSSMLAGATKSVELAFNLIAIYAIWLSILKIMEKVGLNKIIYKLFKPISKALFKGESDLALEYITLNFSANLLGMGGAATPLGIKAIEVMDKNDGIASDNQILFAVINATSIQILPATIIGLRLQYLSQNPSNIIIPTLISTTIATIFGICLCYIMKNIKKGKLYAKLK